jgi:uroporphyrinogen decarboxylase
MLPEALGFKVRFDEATGPMFDQPVSSPAQFTHLSPHAIDEKLSYLPIAIQALKRGLKVPLIGFAGAPFTLASYLIEGHTSKTFTKTKRWAYQDPTSFEALIELLQECVIKSLTLQIKAGCDAVQLFDSWSHILTEEQFLKYSVAPLKSIAKALNAPLIFFCKNSAYRASLLKNTGIQALSVDSSRPIHQVRKELPTLTLQGNLDPEALYLPSNRLKHEVQTLVQSMPLDPAYIFNLGHGILPDTPYQNVIDTVRFVKEIA